MVEDNEASPLSVAAEQYAQNSQAQSPIRRINRIPIVVIIVLAVAFLGVIFYGLASRGLYFDKDKGPETSSGNPASTFADQIKRGVTDGIIGEPQQQTTFQPAPVETKQAEEKTVHPFIPQPVQREVQQRGQELEAEGAWRVRLAREQQEQVLREHQRQRMARLQANDAAYAAPLAIDRSKLEARAETNDATADRAARSTNTGSAPDLYAAALRRARWSEGAQAGMTAVGLVFILASVLPLTLVVLSSVSQASGPNISYGTLTLSNFERIFSTTAWQALSNTLYLTCITTVASTLFAILTAYCIVKKRSGLTSVLDVLLTVPLTVVGTVLGIALVGTFNSGFLVLTGGPLILVIAYFFRRMPFGVRSATGALYSLSDSIEEAAINLGVSPLAAFFKVIVPVMWPAVLAAAIL
ncbi:ABC transporter permease subunit (plasmid) [Rhizobium sp. RCAM05350]|uniref:ABC transporter permease subunit n=1 Tax=Rhizobium sp. RCAM05350 TaxID=2895568 RepID=UPI0020766F6A|nr:ABC transporter permease subunit [Rhizobium sp. RCAM05350]URK89439.1 ABC transporter permease subunit [Rhizobium sp. RCAM05350]